MSKLRLALLGVLVASAASAQPKYTRTTDVKVNVTLSERVKPKAKVDASSGKKPELTSETVLVLEGLATAFRDEQEQILKDLIDQTPDRDWEEKSDYYFRLGELYAKQHRYWRLESVGLSMKSKKQESEAAAKKAKDKLMAAVTTYKALSENDAFKNYPKMDLALFYYGYTLQSSRYFKEARAVYDKLLKNYPNSKYVPEAHLAFGDYYFEIGQLGDAEGRYRQVIKFPNASPYWFAMYKLGWIQLNTTKHQEALETFYKVAQATKTLPKHEHLHRAAKKDFVRAFAEVGKVDKAFVAFQKLDNKGAFDMLAILADLYAEQGKSVDAIYTYQDLMKRAPKHANVCLWQYQITHATLSMPRDPAGDTTKAIVKEIENLTRLYGVLAKGKGLPKAELGECRDNASAMSGELARAYHSEWSKTKNVETLAHAEKLYKVYLDVFPDAENYAETSYYYAELLWARAENEKNPRLQTELWETAAVAFSKIVKLGKLAPAQKQEAAYAAVLGWKNALEVDPQIRKQVGKLDDPEKATGKEYETVPQPKPIPEREQKMLAAFGVYIQLLGGSKKAQDVDEMVRMKFLEANTYRRHNHFAKAIPLFEDILAKHEEHETSEWAANLLLDTHNRMKNFPAMLALADRLSRDKQFLDGKDDLLARLEKLRYQAMRKDAEDKEKRGKATKNFALLVDCGQAYLDIYNANPEAKENDEVLYNALVCYHEGKSVSAAIFAFNALQRFYPNSKLMPRAVGRIGKAYGDIAYYEKAAEKLEEYAKKYAGEADAYSAMNDAVLYRKGNGQDDKAIEDTKYFVRMFGKDKPAIAANAHFSLASIYEKQGDSDGLVRHLREYLAKFASKGGADRVVIAHAKIGLALWAQSCPRKGADGSCVEVKRERAVSTRQSGRLQTQCGPMSKIKLTVVERDARKVKEAMAAFALAAKEYEKLGGKTGGDQAGARHYYAQTKLAVADREFEAYLGHAFPQGLDFDPRNEAIRGKSMKRFDAWVAAKQKTGGSATSHYERVLDVQDSASSIAAAARIGQISQHFSDALFTAEIPKDVRTGAFAEEKVEAFCDRMTEVAEPLEKKSLEAYGVCLDKSTQLGWFSEWSKLCERELGQIKPEQYPTASELRGTPKVATVIAVEAPIRRLE